jgi:hypothetical protein
MTTPQKAKFVTPAGSAQYPWLQPGRPDTAFDAEGKYKLELRVAPDKAQPLVDQLEAMKKEVFAPKDHAKVHLPFKVDDETGEFMFKIQSKFEPKFYDAKGNPIPSHKVPAMYSGSTLRISGMADTYTGSTNGVSLRLNSVQIINPVSGGSEAGPGDFDDVEGGYEVSGDNTPDHIIEDTPSTKGGDDNYDF